MKKSIQGLTKEDLYENLTKSMIDQERDLKNICIRQEIYPTIHCLELQSKGTSNKLVILSDRNLD